MRKINVIFVNYNSGTQLCEGVFLTIKSRAVERIIIVDNGSRDGSMDFLSKTKHKKKIILIKNKKNLGFYKALNIGIRKAFSLGAKNVMPLDFDLNFSYDFIAHLAAIEADMVAPVLKFKMGGKWLYDYGGRFDFIKGSAYHNIKVILQKNIGVIFSSVDKNNPYWFDFISGGCTIIKKRVFEKIGFFDEDFFVYWGDADFAFQAKNKGFRVALDGNTVVHHKIEINYESKNFRKLKISFLDQITFIKKRVTWFYKPIAYLNILLFSVKILLKTFKTTS